MPSSTDSGMQPAPLPKVTGKLLDLPDFFHIVLLGGQRAPKVVEISSASVQESSGVYLECPHLS